MTKTIYIAIILTTLLQVAFGQVNTEIPFLFERNQIIVQIMINDKGPYNFLFDTGTDPSTINKQTAEKIGLQLDTIKREGVGYGENPIIAYLCYFPKMALGNISQDSLISVALNLSIFETKFSIPVVGVLGYSFLYNKRFTIDYPKRKIIFYERELPTPKNILVKQQLILNDTESTPAVEGVSVGGYLLKLIFDTGSSLSLNLSQTADSLYNFSKSMTQLKADTLEGYGGKAISYSGVLKNFEWGKIKLEEVKISIDPNKKSDAYRPVGSIGNELLQNYRVTFDYIDKIVIIEK
jgi:hypothetical protein